MKILGGQPRTNGKHPPPLRSFQKAALGRVDRESDRLCSEVGGGLGWFLPALASDGPASLLPDGEAVAGADLLGVLEEACGASDDATGQPLSRVPGDLG